MPNLPAIDTLDADRSDEIKAQIYDELDTILDDMRTRYDEAPQWEFCEGFMAALICTRRPVDASEYLPVLLDIEDATPEGLANPSSSCFADAEQAKRFMQLWHARWKEIVTGLEADIKNLADAAAYYPELIDIRGAVGSLPEEEQQAVLSEAGAEGLPAYGQVWALGFMFAVENWPEEWHAPRDKDVAKTLDAALQAIVALTEDDTATPTIAMHSEDSPPSVSGPRMEAMAQAIWAVYNLRALWQAIGPRVETVYRADTPGRNEPCFCGSGKKYKKCHGA